MLQKITAIFAISLLFTHCKKTTQNEAIENTSEIESTENVETIDTSQALQLEMLAETLGDLDNDGIEEKVVVYNTDRSSKNGIEREIHFFKKEGSSWKLWKKSNEGILESQMGGVSGDPFRNVVIDNQILKVFHSGGSRSKWETENKYRFQNQNFELIGYTQLVETPCSNKLLIDYNLSTGNAVLQKTLLECNDALKLTSKKKVIDKKVTHKISPLPNLHDGKSTDIVTPLLKAAGEPAFFG